MSMTTAVDLSVASRMLRDALKAGAKFEHGYFIQREDGPVKIGLAKDARTRLGRLQTGSFAAHWLGGEWFAAAPDLLALADEWAEALPFDLRDARGENDDWPLPLDGEI